MKEYYTFLDSFEHSSVAVDKSHSALLYGLIVSEKPESVLEIGLGSGFITETILHALRYNGLGTLYTVDNWHDWKGVEPPHVERLRQMGANIIAPIHEREFIESNQDKRYDMIFVDGNHREGGSWANKTYNMVNYGGFLLAHDVTHPAYPSLRKYAELAIQYNDNYKIFNKSSRPDEMCERGLIVIQKGTKK